MSQHERRKHERRDARLQVALGADGGDLSVTSINIGAGGVYVEVPRFIEPLTKLSLALEIPGPTPEDDSVRVEAEAIVVRTLPEAEDASVDRYEVACAFLDLADESRDVINRYLLTHPAQTSA